MAIFLLRYPVKLNTPFPSYSIDRHRRSYCLALKRNGNHEEVRSVAHVFGRQKNKDCLVGNAAGLRLSAAAASRVNVRRSSGYLAVHLSPLGLFLDFARRTNTSTYGDLLPNCDIWTPSRALIARWSPLCPRNFEKSLTVITVAVRTARIMNFT